MTIPTEIDRCVVRLDAWLDSMRGPQGYGGPVVHWWQQSMLYTGAGLDWRYEGIIAGYINLWERTGNRHWLEKACRAGDDLVAGQLHNGHFAASAFEINPATAGTPHEAACDASLLLLARSLRNDGDERWHIYAQCAERNIQLFYIQQLWDEDAQVIRDSPRGQTFVPNKASTVCSALFHLAEMTGDALWVERYALPTIKHILKHQVCDSTRLDGAIAQNTLGNRRVEKYFPIYNARCIPALLQAYQWTKDEVYADCALRTMEFIARWCYADGTFPTVIYANQCVNRYPAWVAPLGDVLSAADACRAYGFTANIDATQQRLLQGQDESGGIQTAVGFAAQAGGLLPKKPDVRDVLHVVGWNHKAFRYLTAHVSTELAESTTMDCMPFEIECLFLGKSMVLVEMFTTLEIVSRDGVCYCWHKGDSWPEVASSAFWLR